MDIYTYWSQTLEMFKKTFDDQVIFDSIFTLLKAREIRDNELIVTIDSIFNIGYVDDYVDQLQDIYNSIAGTNIKLVIMSDNDYQKQFHSPEEVNDIIYEDHLQPGYTFSNFVVGNSNRIAQNASLAVAMKPGVAYSPLFIYSNSGLGKTHLLHAIGNFAKEKDPNIHVLYCTSEEFVNEYIASLSNGNMDSFNRKYRSMDILLVDDIQFIASKESSSEMFFNIFNSLQNDNKQIVITSDKPPKDLKGMENRLVSRFINGLTVTIDTPEFETAKAILKKKIEIQKVDYPINEEVIDFIASHFNNDVRELEGSVKRLLFYKLVFGKDKEEIDLEFALEAFADTYDAKQETGSLTVDSIKKAVAEYYNLTVNQINSKSRTSNIIVARHIAMYLVRTMISDMSFIQIGKEFGGRDHSTVMKACNKVERNLSKDPNYRKAVNDIKKRISQTQVIPTYAQWKI